MTDTASNRALPVLNLQVGGLAYYLGTHAALKEGCTHLLADSWTSDNRDLSIVDKNLELTETFWRERSAEEAEQELIAKCSLGVFRLRQNRRETLVWAYSKTNEACTALMKKLKELFPQAKRTSNLIDVTFWHYSEHDGPRSSDRQLHAPKWSEIETNYTPDTRAKINKLWTVEPDAEKGGKLILFTGIPGTGKTFAIRAMAEEWGDWCQIHYVMDPEKFFSEGDYLFKVILGGEDMIAGKLNSDEDVIDKEEERPEWRLIVLEDAGELIAKDAKTQVGQGLSRLLNLCEGLLGQGLRVMVLITTNEELGNLHKAVVRPGRILSQISFNAFDRPAAMEWLTDHELDPASVSLPGTITLCDLYLALDPERAAEPEHASIGFR